MRVEKIILFCFLVFCSGWTNAQSTETDSTEFAQFDCGIIQTKQKLNKRFFASTPPLSLRINNDEFTYTTFQLGKRKNSIYLYLKILEKNICIKKDRNVDIYFKSGEIITLKNEYPVNCESFFARQLKKKEYQKLIDNDITMIKIYTYEKNYELYINEMHNHDIKHQLNCLSSYKIKKTDEVVIKKKKSKKNDLRIQESDENEVKKK